MRRRKNPQALPRRGSVYIAVSGTAVLVSLVGFTAMHLSRLELERATVRSERTYARQLAQTGVEFAMAAIDVDPNWRTTHTHNVQSSRNPMGVEEGIRYRFLDNVDGNLGNNSDDPVEIQGIGLYRSSKFIYSVTYAQSATSESDSGIQVLKSYEAGTDAFENVNATAFYGQHFIPTLPAEATSWSISYIDVYLEGQGSPSATLTFKFFSSDTNGKPGTLIETLAVAESSLPANGSPNYHPFSLVSATGLTPGQGYCFTLEQTGGGNAAILNYKGNAVLSDTHMLRGGWGSWNVEPAQAMQFRIHGTYTSSTSSGPFTITPGSWRPTVAN